VTDDPPRDNGVPLRAVVAIGLAASVLARCVAPALPGAAVGIENVIAWTARITALLTLLAATGLIAGLARLATLIVGSPQAPLAARLVVAPAVAMSCLLLLFSSFRPLEPPLVIMLGVTAAVLGALAARHTLSQPERRAGALVVGLTAIGGLIHVLARKLAQDASDTPNLAVFRGAQWLETFGVGIDLVALAFTLVWLQRKAPRGRVLAPLVLAVSAIAVLLAVRGSAPNAGMLSVLLVRGLESFGRNQSALPLLPQAFSHLLNAGALCAAAAALFGGGGELGVVLAAALTARAALDVPVPALLLELGALFLPFTRPLASTPLQPAPSKPEPPTAAAGPDSSSP
jgi:hypothetical protein